MKTAILLSKEILDRWVYPHVHLDRMNRHDCIMRYLNKPLCVICVCAMTYVYCVGIYDTKGDISTWTLAGGGWTWIKKTCPELLLWENLARAQLSTFSSQISLLNCNHFSTITTQLTPVTSVEVFKLKGDASASPPVVDVLNLRFAVLYCWVKFLGIDRILL